MTDVNAPTSAGPAETIRTSRLDLVPMTPEFLRASLERNLSKAAHVIGLDLPACWPQAEAVLALRLQQLESAPSLQPWLLRAIALRGSREMIGHIGFHDAPGSAHLEPWSPGGAEFGYTIFPAHRRKGYAREASQGLMQWARERHGVTGFVLSISPDNLPSRALAASLGFQRKGRQRDELDGEEDVLALQLDR